MGPLDWTHRPPGAEGALPPGDDPLTAGRSLSGVYPSEFWVGVKVWKRLLEFAVRRQLSFASTVSLASILAICAVLLARVDVAGAVMPPAAKGAVPSLPSEPPSPPPTVPAPPQVPAPQAPAPPPAPTPPKPPVHAPAGSQVPPVQAPTVAPSGTAPDLPRSGPPVAPGGSAGTPKPDVDLPSTVEAAGATSRSPGGAAELPHRAAAATDPSEQANGSAHARGGAGPGSGQILRDEPGVGWIDSARPAPLRVLLAYVWPAIALEAVDELLAALQVRLGIPIPRLSFNVSSSPLRLEGVAEDGGVAGLSARSAGSNPDATGARGLSIPFGGTISTLVAIVACAALLALVVLALGREFHSMPRWPR